MNEIRMTTRFLIALLIVGFSDKAFADCVPSPDTPASVIEYFQKFDKPLPEQFCVKEAAPAQTSEDAPRPLERRGHYAELPYGPHTRSPHSGFDWFY
jgi:hypothetical protein